MRHPEHHIFEFTPETLREWCAQRKMAPFRAKQILEWVYQKGVVDPEGMTNLSKRDREILSAEMTFLSGRVLREQLASDGTRKVLVEWSDEATKRRSDEGAKGGETERRRDEVGEGRTVSLMEEQGDSSRQTECVMIPAVSVGAEGDERQRRTACISSQVGCPVGCRFCASGLGGLDGNLSAGRIVEQVWLLSWSKRRRDEETERRSGESEHGDASGRVWDGSGANAPSVRLADSSDTSPARAGEEMRVASKTPRHLPRQDGGGADTAQRAVPPGRITNVVFMGMGEPLANFKAVTKAVRILNAAWGMGISARRITISTVGLPQAIERLAAEMELPVTLALSLHAPNDEIRRALIPWADYTTIAELLAACHQWFKKTGREITLEYTLLRGVNDRPEHAEELARVARTLRSSVNLIRYNEVGGLPFQRPRDEDVLEFQRILRERGVNARIRASRGRDIAAACGQLRHEGQPA